MSLTGVFFDGDSSKNKLSENRVIANVLETPDANPSDRVIYQTATAELRINGTGFAGAKDVDLYFKPPLYSDRLANDESGIRSPFLSWKGVEDNLVLIDDL